MAERRMFAKTIIDSDSFLDMPLTTQALYFHLNMRADDDGFVNNPKKIARMIGASDDDLKLLIAKSFILIFENGVIVIKHWRLNNYIRGDRHHETVYAEEKALLSVKKNGSYSLSQTDGCQLVDTCQANGCQLVDTLATEVRLGKDRLGKDRLGKDRLGKDKCAPDDATTKHRYGEFEKVLLRDEEFNKLVNEYGLEMTNTCIDFLDSYIKEKGYKSKEHYLSIKRWVVDAVKERETKSAKVETGVNAIDWGKV